MTFRHCPCPACQGKGERHRRSRFQYWATALCVLFLGLTMEQWEIDPWPRVVAIGVAVLCMAVKVPVRCNKCSGAGKILSGDAEQVQA